MTYFNERLLIHIHSFEGICRFIRAINTQVILATVVALEYGVAFRIDMTYTVTSGADFGIIWACRSYVVEAPGSTLLTACQSPFFQAWAKFLRRC